MIHHILAVHLQLPNGKSILASTRFFARAALPMLGYARPLPDSLWEPCCILGATVHLGGLVLRPTHTSNIDDLDGFDAVDPYITRTLGLADDNGYTVGQSHPGVARSFAEAVADCEQAERDGTL